MNKNIYAIYSEDEVLLDEEALSIIKSKSDKDIDILSYDAEDIELAELLNELETIPFLTEMKIIVVKHPIFLKKAVENESLKERLISFFKSDNAENILIILINEKYDSALEVTKELMKVTTIKNLRKLTGDDLANWVKEYLANENYKIDFNAIELLLNYVNKDSLKLKSELDKIMLYAIEEKVITVDIIKNLVSKDLEEDIYQLLNAFLDKNKERILQIYGDFKIRNEDEMRLINMLSNKLEEILYTKILLKMKKTKDEIATYFNVSSGRAYYMTKNATHIKDIELQQLINRLNQLDFNIKSGKMEKRLGFELFLLGA